MIKYSLLHPADFKLDGGAMFGIIPKPLWDKKISADELNRIEMTMRVLMIESPHRKILIDTGIGDYHDEKFRQNFSVKTEPSPLIKALAKAQINPAQITDIIITHLHFDHVGGLGSLKNGKTQCLFPNATVHLHQKHYEYAKKPNIRDQGSFQSHIFTPLLQEYLEKKQLHLHQDEKGIILEDGDYKLSYTTTKGHTPYQMHPFDNHFFYFGDIIPTSHHIPIPWVMGYDMNPGKTTEEKLQLLDMILKNGLTVIFNHDLDYWGAKVGIDERKRFCFEQLMKSKKTNIEKIELTN